MAQIHAAVLEIGATLRVFQHHIYAQHTTPRGLGTHWAQQPVTLEDALGRLIPLPLELVDSWDMFNMILSKRFENHPGYQKVAKGEFAIEESLSGMEVHREWNWSQCFRPGQKVDMTMVFSASPYLDMAADCCPRCKTKISATVGSRAQWYVIGYLLRIFFDSADAISVNSTNSLCGMWIQRVIEEVAEDSDSDSMSDSLGKHPQEEIDSDRMRPTSRGILRPEQFQRVRLSIVSFLSRYCHSCNRLESSRWRRGPDGAGTLCDECGAHYAKLTRRLDRESDQLLEHLPESPVWDRTRHNSSFVSAGEDSLGTTALGKSLGSGRLIPRAILREALQNANLAVLRDNEQDPEGAMQAYSETCDLLQDLMLRSRIIDEDKRKVEEIVSVF